MGVDEAGEEDTATEVDNLVGDVAEVAEDVSGLAYGLDAVAGDDEAAGAENAGGGVDGDDCGVVEEQAAEVRGGDGVSHG